MKSAFVVTVFSFFAITAMAQEFVNGDLEGALGGGVVPPSWQKVPFFDPNCQANSWGSDSPDILWIDGPMPASCYYGLPYSGQSFVAGGYGDFSNGQFFQEGIMQEVGGFSIDSVYTICFYQTVVKNINNRDSSGSWLIILQDSVLGSVSPTIGPQQYCDIHYHWEKRCISFESWDTSYLVKFLPLDDDTAFNYHGDTTSNGGLLMGVDSISLVKGTVRLGLGVDYPTSDEQFTIYPNPVSELVRIESASTIQEVRIRNLLGQMVLRFRGSNIESVDVSDVPKGILILEIITRTGFGVQRIVKK